MLLFVLLAVCFIVSCFAALRSPDDRAVGAAPSTLAVTVRLLMAGGLIEPVCSSCLVPVHATTVSAAAHYGALWVL
jgi:hypothetical protein